MRSSKVIDKPTVSPLRSHRARPRRPIPGGAPPAKEVPAIQVGFDQEAVADAGIAALAACPELFTYDGHLVTLVPIPSPGAIPSASEPALRIDRLPAPRLRELLSRSAQWLVPNADGSSESTPSHVPQWVVPAIASRRQWPGLRPLTALITSPVLRPDGTLFAAPGYDPTTGLYLTPRMRLPAVLEQPTLADAQAAVDVLLAKVRHIPFAAPVDRAAWLALVLTPPSRFAVGASAPLSIIEDGGSSRWSEELIADLAALMGAVPPAVVDADDLLSALRRRLEAIRASGEPAVRITNGSTRTAVAWRRIHEELQRARAMVGLAWVASTTRSARDTELAKHALVVRCEEAPGSRQGPDEPVDDASPERLLVAALTVLRAYQVAGRPDQGLPRWPGFEQWSAVVRSAVVWSGLPDPVSSAPSMPRPISPTAATIADLLVGWSELAQEFPGGCSARQALDTLERAPAEAYPRLRQALEVLAPGPLGDRGTADRLGRSLTRFRDEQHEGRAIVRVGSGNQGNRWAVRSGSR